MVKMVPHEAFACRCEEGDVVLRQSYKHESYGKDIKVKKSKNEQKPTRNEETSTRERYEERYQNWISRQQEKKVNEDPM
ncbi:hypothetical protein Tco_0620146 [Tanacetum coccineum]